MRTVHLREGLINLLQKMVAAGFRLPVVLEGQRDWAISEVELFLAWRSDWKVLWVTDQVTEQRLVLPEKKVNHELGQEFDAVVFDFYSNASVDALAAVAGSIKRGGCLFLVCPGFSESVSRLGQGSGSLRSNQLDVPSSINSRGFFYQRMGWLLQSCDTLAWFTACQTFHLPVDPVLIKNKIEFTSPWHAITQDQHSAIEAILSLARGRANRPLVLQADRGRGKSAALGLAVNALLNENKTILVTAPRPDMVGTVMRFAGENGPSGSGELETSAFHFIAPDRLLETLPHADILLVDEAAAIAPALLADMLRNYNRVVMATTVNGYEGTGRGFQVRFKQHLNQQYPNWRLCELNEPIRWQTGDWLENVLNQLLLLKPQSSLFDADLKKAVYSSVQADTLQFLEFKYSGKNNETKLNAIFELLTSAHYRTRPSDLKMMLDADNVRVFTLSLESRVLAVVLIAVEGALETELIQAVMEGKRRPKGHILPQSLMVHAGVEHAFEARYWRVIRIAVQPLFQSKQLGSILLEKVCELAKLEAIDMVGAVFSGTEKLLHFWYKNRFELMRIGYTREVTTGSYASLMCRGLSAQGGHILDIGKQYFTNSFPYTLMEAHRTLPAEYVAEALCQIQPNLSVSDVDQVTVKKYVAGFRVYENVSASLWRWICYHWNTCHKLQLFTSIQLQLIVYKVLQKYSWSELVSKLDLVGQKQAKQQLRDAVILMWEAVGE